MDNATLEEGFVQNNSDHLMEKCCSYTATMYHTNQSRPPIHTYLTFSQESKWQTTQLVNFTHNLSSSHIASLSLKEKRRRKGLRRKKTTLKQYVNPYSYIFLLKKSCLLQIKLIWKRERQTVSYAHFCSVETSHRSLNNRRESTTNTSTCYSHGSKNQNSIGSCNRRLNRRKSRAKEPKETGVWQREQDDRCGYLCLRKTMSSPSRMARAVTT